MRIFCDNINKWHFSLNSRAISSFFFHIIIYAFFILNTYQETREKNAASIKYSHNISTIAKTFSFFSPLSLSLSYIFYNLEFFVLAKQYWRNDLKWNERNLANTGMLTVCLIKFSSLSKYKFNPSWSWEKERPAKLKLQGGFTWNLSTDHAVECV